MEINLRYVNCITCLVKNDTMKNESYSFSLMIDQYIAMIFYLLCNIY